MRIFRKLAQLLDVEIVSPVDNDRLQFEASSGKWKNTSVSGVAPHHGSHEEGGTDEVSVTVGIIDAEASASGQVPTSDGAGGVTWEDQSGSGADDQTAAEVPFAPAGTIAATDTQAAVEEVASDAASALSTHSSDTTGVHGIADTADLVLDNDSRLTDSRTPSGAAGGVLGGTYPNPSFAADMATQAELDAHVTDTSAAHAASAISADSTTLVGTGTDVQAVLEELDNGIADHLADSSAAHAASAISFTPAGTIAATDVQAAIEEVASEAGGGGTSPDDVSLIVHMEVFA